MVNIVRNPRSFAIEAFDICPYCHKGINPVYESSTIHSSFDYAIVIWSCPLLSCRKLIASQYNLNIHTSQGSFRMFLGNNPIPKIWPDTRSKKSKIVDYRDFSRPLR
jgi:hypothetical protein